MKSFIPRSIVCSLFVAVVLLCSQSVVLAYKTFLCTGGIFNKNVSEYGGQCVEYVRYETGLNIYGNANTWYEQAQVAGYVVGSTIEIGSIVVMGAWNNNPAGHIGIVIDKRNNNQEAKLRHSNWYWNELISEDWIDISRYPILGYIYCDGDGSDSEQVSKVFRTVGQIGWYPANKTCINADYWARIEDGKAVQSFGDNSACYSAGLEYIDDIRYQDVLFGTGDLPAACMP